MWNWLECMVCGKVMDMLWCWGVCGGGVGEKEVVVRDV